MTPYESPESYAKELDAPISITSSAEVLKSRGDQKVAELAARLNGNAIYGVPVLYHDTRLVIEATVFNHLAQQDNLDQVTPKDMLALVAGRFNLDPDTINPQGNDNLAYIGWLCLDACNQASRLQA